MRTSDWARLERILEAKVPLQFLEGAFREVLLKDLDNLPEEYRDRVKAYLKECNIVPPDIRGQKWSYLGALKLIQEYWGKIKKYAEKNPEFREELEDLISYPMDSIKFNSNYEVQMVLGLKPDPLKLRTTKLPLIAVLLLLAIELGDIGTVKKKSAKKVQEILEYFLSQATSVIPDIDRLKELLKEALTQEKEKVTV